VLELRACVNSFQSNSSSKRYNDSLDPAASDDHPANSIFLHAAHPHEVKSTHFFSMGRINLTPLRVRRRALANLETRRTTTRPVWLDIVGDIPPAQIFIRSQPQKHPLAELRSKPFPPTSSTKRKRKASKLFQPVQIKYEEDQLRKRFFSDHPWELARPRVVLERDGDEGKGVDWSRGVKQRGRPTTGEDVVQRQLHLLQTELGLTIDQAYDKARKEFYDIRRQEDIQRRIAAEEAENSGAYFGPSILQWSMQIENKQYDDWEEWSRKSVVEQMQRNAAFAGDTTNVENVENVENAEDDLLEDMVEEGNKTGSEVFAAEGARQAAQGRRAIT
jgi:small subunit ribosomal protein S23